MIYLLIALFMFFAVFHFDIRGMKMGKTMYYIIIMIILTFLLGLRYRVGGDSLAYEQKYGDMPTFDEIARYGLYGSDSLKIYQPLWLYSVAVCKAIGKDYYIFQFFHAIFVNSFLFLFIYKKSSKPFSVIFFLFITHYYFYFTMEIQREMMAICIFLFNIRNLEQKKWVPYYALCFVSFMFHISAFFLFILPLFKIVNFSKKSVLLFVVAFTPLIFFRDFFLDVIKPILFMDTMQSKMGDYEKISFSLEGTIGFYFTRVIAFIPILVYVFRKNSQYEEKRWMFTVYILVSVLSLALVGFERFLNYFIIPLVIIFIDLLYTLKSYERNEIVRYFIIGAVFVNMFFSIPWRLFTTSKTGDKYYYLFFPYVSQFDKKYIWEREKFIENQWDL